MVMFFEFFLWWYGKGWRSVWQNSLHLTAGIAKAFSVGVLLRTLFAPWKRIIAAPGGSIDEKIRGLIDNLTSRAVGFFVRIGALGGAFIAVSFSIAAGIVAVASWPMVPLIAVYLIYKGIAG